MKLGEIKKLVKESDITSITPELLRELGSRYLEKFGKEKGWYWAGVNTGYHSHHKLANQLKNFQSSYPVNTRKKSLECCYVLADILAQTGDAERSWLGGGIIDILNTALDTRVTKQHDVGPLNAVISRGRSACQFIENLDAAFPIIALPQRDKQHFDESRQEKAEMISNLLKNTSKDCGGKGISFAGKFYKIPQGVFNALKENHLVVDKWFSRSSVTLEYNKMAVEDLKKALTSAISDYSRKENASKSDGRYGTRTEATNIMYRAFEEAEEAEQYFQAAKPVVNVGGLEL
ncbi:hypothetical protein PsalN5692_01543 [Piscirickettsia salmonis]|uniref:hypothetical protein n=1 Tax=Piscirickettsia salmonis TaxID=1238 RepID=UPI0012B9EF58|nr:hypothetical protein [Piscirickettsia salmonis]QGP50083.1 hypothetical protein PsalN5692_01543 [Piscirickettsia salmonis]